MNLEELAIKYGTDKQCQDGHGYTPYYEKYLEPVREKDITLLELGVREGWSMNMWTEYFPNGEFWGIDNDKEGLCPKSFSCDRVHFHLGSQDDKLFLENICNVAHGFDVIIDDASHISSLSIKSFEILFDHVKPGGIYIIEDLHVSGLPEYNPNNLSTLQYFYQSNRPDDFSIELFINKIMFVKKRGLL